MLDLTSLSPRVLTIFAETILKEYFHDYEAARLMGFLESVGFQRFLDRHNLTIVTINFYFFNKDPYNMVSISFSTKSGPFVGFCIENINDRTTYTDMLTNQFMCNTYCDAAVWFAKEIAREDLRYLPPDLEKTAQSVSGMNNLSDFIKTVPGVSLSVDDVDAKGNIVLLISHLETTTTYKLTVVNESHRTYRSW